jgi:outer membrane protein, heavy metal efflux system
MRSHLFIVLGLLAGGAGCAIYHPEPISPSQTAAQLDSRRLDDPGLKQFIEQNLGQSVSEWPLKKWDLAHLTLAAFYFQPGLAVARAQWQAVDAGVKTAAQRENPTVNVAPGYNSTTRIPTPWMVDAGVDLPIETMGKRSKRIDAAKHLAAAARFDFITTAWKTRSDLRADLVEFLVSGRRANLLQREFSAQQGMVKLLQQRFDAGEISRPDLTTAQMALSRTQLDFADARAKQAESRSLLAQAIGVSSAALDGLDIDFDFTQGAPSGLGSADARHEALLSRSDLLSSLAEYASAEADLRLEIAKQYPDIHLNPGYQYDQGDNKWSVGLTLELPLLNQNRGPIAEAGARRKLAGAKFVALQSQVIGEIDRAVAGYHIAEEQLKTADLLFEASRQQHESSGAQLRAGAADAVDALGAELEFDAASLGQLENQARFQAAVGALEDAVQRPVDLMTTIEKISTTSKETRK